MKVQAPRPFGATLFIEEGRNNGSLLFFKRWTRSGRGGSAFQVAVSSIGVPAPFQGRERETPWQRKVRCSPCGL